MATTTQIPEEVQWVLNAYEDARRTAAKAASDIARLEPHMIEHEQRLAEMRAMHADAGRARTNATANTHRLRWLLEAACAKADVPVPESPDIAEVTQVDLGVRALTPCEQGHCDECDNPNCNCLHHVNGTPTSPAPAPARDADPAAEPEQNGALFGALFNARPAPKRIGRIAYAIHTIGLWLVPPHHGRHIGGAVHA